MKKPILFLLYVVMMGFSVSSRAHKGNPPAVRELILVLDTLSGDSLIFFPEQELSPEDSLALGPALDEGEKRKKLVSGMLAFPFPFGFMGAHRVMLGTKPWVPVVYVATIGGCFGLLPLIDFCVIMFSKDIEHYENNPNIFMWVK